MTPTVSILICTRNRGESLRPTIDSMRHCALPERWEAELLVVDNGSTDDTERVVRFANTDHLQLRYVHESRPGKGHAYNTGIANSRGAVLLWSDDDVRVPKNWVEEMCRPILVGRADAVAGGVRIAPHLERAWLKGDLRGWVGATGGTVDLSLPGCVVGANMAFGRHILEKVPGFDTELGPGALGFYDEALFWKQMLAAGAKIVGRSDVSVEHHFSDDRLNAAGFEIIAQKLGRSLAYVHHHWEHGSVKIPWLRWAFWKAMQTARGGLFTRSDDTPDPAYLFRVFHLAFLHQFLVERKRPRNYERHGLVKLRNENDRDDFGARIPRAELQAQ